MEGHKKKVKGFCEEGDENGPAQHAGFGAPRRVPSVFAEGMISDEGEGENREEDPDHAVKPENNSLSPEEVSEDHNRFDIHRIRTGVRW